jgi:hypothetical protein
MAAEVSKRATQMAEFAGLIVDGDGSHILTVDHQTKLGVIRSELADLSRSIGVDANAAVKAQ